MTDLKPSCHLITWGRGPGATERALDEASSLGYRACETFTDVGLSYEDRMDEFRAMLADRDMKLSALYAGARGEGGFSNPDNRATIVEYNARVARFIAANGADRIVLGPSRRAEGSTSREDLENIVKTVNEVARRTLDLGVRACVHPHMYTEIQNRHEVDYVMENTDPSTVFFAPDTAHLAKAGMDPAEVMRTYGERIAYLHLKDVTPDDPDAEQFPIRMERPDEALPIFCELGLGTVDFPPIIDVLSEINYEGWITIEIDKSTSTPLQSLTMCRDFVEQTLNIPIQGRKV